MPKERLGFGLTKCPGRTTQYRKRNKSTAEQNEPFCEASTSFAENSADPLSDDHFGDDTNSGE